MFCSLMIGSRSLNEPVPLDCEFHKCLSAPSLPEVGQDGWKGLELGIFLPLESLQ